MSDTLARIIIEKLDNGFKGRILDWDTPEAVALGKDLFNRQLKRFSAGSLLYALVNITPTKRRTIKKVWPKKSPIEETTLLTVRLAGEPGWLNAAETKLLRDPERYVEMAPWTSDTLTVTITGKDIISATRDFYDAKDASEDAPEEDAPDPTVKELEEEEPEMSLEDLVRGLSVDYEPEVEVKEHLESVLASPATKRVDRLSGYYIDPQSRLVFNTAKAMSDARPERAVKVMMVGASGYGKTTLPKLFAELSGKKFLRMNCATIRDPEEWFGYREAVDGSTLFVRSEFGRAIQDGNLVVVLDEFNRLEPWLHNTLFPLLDDDGCTVVHDEKFSIGPGVIVVGTINTGYRYTGTFELDEALYNRFDFILEVGPMPFEDEVKVLTNRTAIDKGDAGLVVKVANILRPAEVVCSTRTTLLVAQMVVAGMTLREAYEAAVVRRIPADSNGATQRKSVVDLINVQLGPYEPRALDADIFAEDKPVRARKPRARKEEDTTGKVFRASLRHNRSQELGYINLIRALRTLPVYEGEGSEQFHTLSEAKALADSIRDGNEVFLTLTHRPTNLSSIITELRQAGATGVFKWEEVN